MGSDFSLPVWAYPLVAMLVPWLFFAGGAVGVNPIISGTLSGSILGPIWPDYGLLALGFGIVTGWGITIAGTPFSANALLLERCTGYNTRVAAYDWSFRYSVISLAVSSLICGVLALPFYGQMARPASLVSRYSSMPSWAPSGPRPLFFMHPNCATALVGVL